MSSPTPPPKLVTWSRAPASKPFDAADHNTLIKYQNGELAAPQTWVAEDGTPGMAWDPATGMSVAVPMTVDGPVTVTQTPPAVPTDPIPPPASNGHLTPAGQVKGYAVFVGATGALSAGYNVATVTRTSTGVYTVTWATAFDTVNYAVCLSYLAGAARIVWLTTRTVTAVGIAAQTTAAVAADPTSVSVVAFGTLAP